MTEEDKSTSWDTDEWCLGIFKIKLNRVGYSMIW